MAEKVIIKEETDSSSSFNFKNYLAGIKKFKWWVLGFTVGCAVVGFIGFKFILNPMRSVFTGTYKYELAGKMEENGSYRLIDGTTFDYQDVVSKEVLEEVKASREEYKSIDVEKIHKNNAITVERILESSKNSKTQEETTVDISYKITAKTNVFPKGDVGKQFVDDLVNYPKQMSTKAIENCGITSYIDDSTKNESFEKQLYALRNQYNAIVASYKELSADFSGMTSTGQPGESVSSAYSSFLSKYSDGAIDAVKVLEGRMYADFYVNYEVGHEDEKILEIREICRSYIDNIKTYEAEYKLQQQLLEDYLAARPFSTTTQNEEVLGEIAELKEKVLELNEACTRIRKQLNSYGYFEASEGVWEDRSVPWGDPPQPAVPCVLKNLADKDPTWVSKNNAFRTEIKSLLDSLKEDRESATKVYKNVYSLHRNKVSMIESGYIATDKYIPDVIGLVGLAVVGFVITTLVTTGVYISKKDKKED